MSVHASIPEPVSDHLEDIFESVAMPPGWTQEGIEPPSRKCLSIALHWAQAIYTQLGLIPYKVTASPESGVYFACRHKTSKNILRVEVDNDLDACATVSDGHQVLASGLLDDAEDRDKIFRAVG